MVQANQQNYQAVPTQHQKSHLIIQPTPAMKQQKNLIKKFDRASRVLHKKQTPYEGRIDTIDEGEELSEEGQSNDLNDRQIEESEDSCLFADDNNEGQPKLKRLFKAIKEEDPEERHSQYLVENDANSIPVRRTHSRSQNQLEIRSETNPTRRKSKYKKSDNMGNIFYEEKQISDIFKHLCEPSGKITVNSLGYALQKYHIDFEKRDLVEMIKLFYDLKGIELEFCLDSKMIIEDDRGELDLSLNLNEQQLKELYKLVRRKK